VPAGRHAQPQGNGQRLAGYQRGSLGEQFCFNMRRVHRRRCRDGCPSECDDDDEGLGQPAPRAFNK